MWWIQQRNFISCEIMWSELNNTRAPLFLCVSAVGDPPLSAKHTTAETHRSDQTPENTVKLCVRVHKGSLCVCCLSAHIMVISFIGCFSQILTHGCLNHNCSSLFLPHPHLSVMRKTQQVQLTVQTGLIDMIHTLQVSLMARIQSYLCQRDV